MEKRGDHCRGVGGSLWKNRMISGEKYEALCGGTVESLKKRRRLSVEKQDNQCGVVGGSLWRNRMIIVEE